MKKILAALLVASFGAGLMAQQLVYEYKASIKRLDPTFQVKSNKSGKFVAQSYKVASDTISGYVILPACVACANGLDKNMSDYFKRYWLVDDKDNPIDDDNDGIQDTWDTNKGFGYNKTNPDLMEDHNAKGYFIRKGDKLSKANTQFEDTWEYDGKKYSYQYLKKGKNIPYVLQTTVEGAAALFGAYQQLGPTDADKPQSDIKAANKAWMRLEYYLPTDAANINPEKILKGIGYSIKRDGPLYIGFLGLTNYGTSYKILGVDQNQNDIKEYDRKVYHTGFGTAQETSTIGTTGWCANTKGKSCIIVKSITGTLVGYPRYQGVCYVTPMWDVCYAEKSEDGNPSVVNDAVICGSWTLKYNKNVTEKYNSANGDDDAELQVILDQFGKKIGKDRVIKLGTDYKPLYDGNIIL